MLSLGLGITLLVTVIEIDGNLRRQFSNELPAKAPSFYFLDIPADQTERFETFIRAQAPSAKLDDVPMLRGRIISAGGMPAENIKPREDAAWVLQSDRGITYASEIPTGSRLVEGQWWGKDYNGPPLVSFEKRIADGLGLKLGDPVTVNVLGRNITATIANMRHCRLGESWHQFRHGVLTERFCRSAAHSNLATLTYPGGGTPAQEAATIRAVAEVIPDGHRRARKGRAGSNRQYCRQPGAGHSRRQRHHACRRRAGARRRTRGRPSPSGLRRGDPENAWRHATSSDFGLRDRVPADRRGHGPLRGHRRLARGLVDRCAAHAPAVYLVALAGVGGGAGVAVMVTVTLGLAGTYVALGQKPAPVLRNL